MGSAIRLAGAPRVKYGTPCTNEAPACAPRVSEVYGAVYTNEASAGATRVKYRRLPAPMKEAPVGAPHISEVYGALCTNEASAGAPRIVSD